MSRRQWYLVNVYGIVSPGYDKLPDSLPQSSTGAIAADVTPVEGGEPWVLHGACKYVQGRGWKEMDAEEIREHLGGYLV